MSAFIREFDLHAQDAIEGPTIAIKDSIDIAGYPTTAASRALADAPAAVEHAEVVQRLLDAGWRIKGKANMHELAFGMTGINDFTGTPQNPQDATRIPGGSSSGSASAVGLGLVDAALGTDTGGSVRGPAACCGVIGLKPTFGRVSRRGVAPTDTTLDCVGPFARDMRMLIDAMAAIDPSFDAGIARREASKTRVGIVAVDADASIRIAVDHAAHHAGFASRKIELTSMADAFCAGLAIINAETWHAFGHFVETGKLGADLDARLRIASNTTAADLEAAENVRRVFTAAVDRALEDIDVLLLPTLPAFPITLEAARTGTSVIAMSSLIRPFNLSGHPALSLPLPIEGSSIKAGLQIVGRKGADEKLCAVAAHVEAALAQQRNSNMSNRIALITGAARGLGAAVARRFHAAGYKVALADIAIEATQSLARELSEDLDSAFALKLDVTSKADFEHARDAVHERWGRIDVLVNNAGASKVVPVMQITAEQFNQVIDVNLRSVLFGCQVLGRYFADRGAGRIVNIASLAGQNGGSATGAHYASAKGGAITLTKVFARDLAAYGVTVNAISPGPLDLAIVHESVAADKLDKVIAGIPVGRLGSADYIADVAVLLASPDAYFANGACWDVNGGLYMR